MLIVLSDTLYSLLRSFTFSKCNNKYNIFHQNIYKVISKSNLTKCYIKIINPFTH